MKLNRTGYSKCKTTIKLVIIVCFLFLTACKNAPTDNNIAQLKSEFQNSA